MTTFQVKFGKKLKELRMAAGLSQAQFAENIGAAEKTVSYWENGHNAVTFNKLPIIAKALGVPVYKLFVFGDILGGDNSEIADLLNSLTDKERTAVDTVIKAILAIR